MKLITPASICIMVLFTGNLYAQPSLLKMKSALEKDMLQQPVKKITLINSTQAGVLFKSEGNLLDQNDVVAWLSEKLLLRQGDDQLIDENKDVKTADNVRVKKIHQYYKGIKVEHGVINITSHNEKVGAMQLEFYSVPDGFDTRALLSAEEAFNKAITYMNAETYAWGNGTDTTDEDRRKPKGELVIIQTYSDYSGQVCLAYKFNMYAINPLKRSYIYVNAQDGKVVLDDAIIKHAKREGSTQSENKIESVEKNKKISNTPAVNVLQVLSLTEPINNAAGTADTRYNGRRNILGDRYSATNLKPYRLRAVRNNHDIIILNYQQHNHHTDISPSYESTAPDFTDNNNDWTAAEYDNDEMDNGATDVMDNMIWVSDYWKNVHDRNSWNNNNGNVVNYVHVYSGNNPYDNAYWNGKNMHFGDGNGNPDVDPVATSLDDCAHELAHGVTQTTCNLVYRWESGALNEAFSDIWAACITNYAKVHDATLGSEITYRLFEKSSQRNNTNPGPGLRDMRDPRIFQQPSTYHSTFWVDGDYVNCAVPSQAEDDPNRNDNCGVHTNSGVLNKWFFLITEGEASTNTKGKPYNITGLGFAISQKIAYLTELNLTPNSGYANCMTVSINSTATLYGIGSAEYNTVKAAWAAVGVDTSNTFNMVNTPVFSTNNFTSITVASDDIVFAGTNYSGFYQFDGTDWTKRTELPDLRINDIKTDINGDVWIAQSGRSGTQGGGSSIAGGVNHLLYPYDANSVLYTVNPLLHVPSRNARCMYVDNARLIAETNMKVWVATTSYITSSNSTSGMLGVGLQTSYKEFLPISEGINIASGTAGCLTVGGNRNEIWTFVQANNGINQLLSYNAETNALITTYDHNSVPTIPSGFVARAIYGDRYQRIWIGLANGGILIYDEQKRWHYVNASSIFPVGVQVNFNAITGNRHGDVYIGTSAGLVYFDAGGGWANRLEDTLYYRRYGKANGLMSDNINAIACDENRFKLWVASDSGIVIWDSPCIGTINCWSTPANKNNLSVSKRNGNWSDTAVWDSGLIPDSLTAVVIKDTIAVDINGQCQSLSVSNPGRINVNTGKNLKVFGEKEMIMTNDEQRRRRQR